MDGEGPRQQLNVAKFKEVELKKKQDQRLIRAELRKEKRNAKCEAKQARKQNVQQAAEWTPELRAMDKQEKRRKRMHPRADKLEAQALKLRAEAQKARARADIVDRQKEDEDSKKNKLKKEIKQMAEDSENEDRISVSTPLTTDGLFTNTRSEEKQRREDAKLQDKALDQIMEQELGPSITASGRHLETEAERKRKRKEEKRAKKRKREVEVHEVEAPMDSTDADAEANAEDEVETPRERKKKRKLEKPRDDENGAEATPVKKDKKKKKKDKKEQQRNDDTSTPTPTPTINSEANPNSGDQWNVSALEGDSKRKQKFLRLLGAGKSNGIANGGTTLTSSKADIARMQSDLERQFDVGMKMKKEGHSHRKGLGA
ncbi:small acidic protein family-domain-containing protein [Xylaria grammica]|nr:small acidic protein family-domain-containing protein [Xylaria grammica]